MNKLLNIHIEGTGRPLVFLHGWGFDHSIWKNLTNDLRHNYQLFLVDLPGFGKSSIMSWIEFKQMMCAQLPKQFALAGWSMGGLYATRFMIEEPARVTHLLNIASSPRFTKMPNWSGIDDAVLAQFYKNLMHDYKKTAQEFVQLQLQQCSSLVSLPVITPTQQALCHGLDILSTWDLRYEIQSIQKPVGYFFGKYDTIVSKKTMLHMQKHYPNFTYVLFSDAAHMLFLSNQDLFITELNNFLLS